MLCAEDNARGREGLLQDLPRGHGCLQTSLPSPLSRNRSEREVRAAALVLQTVWGYKELRKPLEKEGWKKSDFQVWGGGMPCGGWGSSGVLQQGEGCSWSSAVLVSSLPVPGGIALQSSGPRGPHKRTDRQAGGLVALRATAAVLKNQVLQGSVSFPKAGPVLAAGAAVGTGAVGPWCWGLQGGMCWWRVSVPGCEWSLSAPGEPEQHLSDPGRQLV